MKEQEQKQDCIRGTGEHCKKCSKNCPQGKE